MKTVVFADLDGTLLTEKYSFRETAKIVNQLLTKQISIVLCSSKTKLEVEYYRNEMNILDPFVTENGAAIFIPLNYFKESYTYTIKTEKYKIIELGITYEELRQKLKEITSRTASKIVGFGDMSLDEISEDTGLNADLSQMAKNREYDEPFRIIEGDKKEIFAQIEKQGLSVVEGGKYYHLSGKHDKGLAVAILKKLYQKDFGKVKTIAVGNSKNDLPMLRAVDTPFLIGEKDNLVHIWKSVAKIA